MTRQLPGRMSSCHVPRRHRLWRRAVLTRCHSIWHRANGLNAELSHLRSKHEIVLKKMTKIQKKIGLECHWYTCNVNTCAVCSALAQETQSDIKTVKEQDKKQNFSLHSGHRSVYVHRLTDAYQQIKWQLHPALHYHEYRYLPVLKTRDTEHILLSCWFSHHWWP